MCFYCIRPEHKHAKAGNLNYTLERTNSNLVVTLDADFIARPNLLQRLLPYHFVWNEKSEKYDFNETLAAVQTPQHFRNLSPSYDSDPFDQRTTSFSELVLPGKDWFNACPLIGTANFLSRSALQEANYFPYESVTEDSGMALAFHKLRYRTYYVNESLASGLTTTSIWSNFDQRERWLKGDWQIFFSENGPLFVKGLTIIQRLLYVIMSYSRLLSMVHVLYDVASVLVLVFGVSIMDVSNTTKFLQYLGTLLVLGVVARLVKISGGLGLEKSETASAAFEVVFRFVSVK